MSWYLSEEFKIAEAEANRMFPENYNMGRWDGIVSTEEVERLMYVQRRAYLMGEEAAYRRIHGEE